MTFTAFFELSWDVVWNPGTFPPVIIKKWDTKKQLLSHKNENIIEGFFSQKFVKLKINVYRSPFMLVLKISRSQKLINMPKRCLQVKSS